MNKVLDDNIYIYIYIYFVTILIISLRSWNAKKKYT